MTIQKDNRALYGVTSQPHVGTELWVKDMPFDHNGSPDHTGKLTRVIQTYSWWLVNRNDGTALAVNSYDGKLGRNYNPERCRFILTAPDLARKLAKGYTRYTGETPAWAELVGVEGGVKAEVGVEVGVG